MLSHTAGSNFDTSWFGATIELDGTVQERFPFGDGKELFNLCKAKDPVIENKWRTKIFKSNVFVIHKVLLKFTKILSHKYLEPYGKTNIHHIDRRNTIQYTATVSPVQQITILTYNYVQII